MTRYEATAGVFTRTVKAPNIFEAIGQALSDVSLPDTIICRVESDRLATVEFGGGFKITVKAKEVE